MASHQEVDRWRGRDETRACIMSLMMSPRNFPAAVQNRWAIRNRLHWVFDVRMQGDDFRNREGRGPENLAEIGRLVLNIVRLKDDKLLVRRRLLRVARVPEYRPELIGNAEKSTETILNAFAPAAATILMTGQMRHSNC